MGAVFAIFAGFFRHGQASNELEVTQFRYALIANVPRLYNVLQSNESVIWGIVKWVKSIGRIPMIVCLSSLPCLAKISLSSAKAKLHLKNGSPKPSPLPSGGSNKIRELLFESVTILISIIGQSIKEANLNSFPGLLGLKKALSTGTVRSLNMGTPNRLSFLNSSTFLSWFTNRREVNLLNFYVTKPLRSVLKSLVGGKIAEKAKVLGNAKNTGYRRSESYVKNRELNSELSSLNSVSLNKISNIIPIGRAYSTQDLTSSGVSRSEAPSLSTPNVLSPPTVPIDEDKPLNIREQVELKQKELVRLAERHGLFDPRVLQAQLLMVRSLLFRTHAANLMTKKAGSKTPGVDNEIIDKTDIGASKEQLIGWMRDMVYHPNRYKTQTIQKVWIQKPGKSEKRPLEIPTVKDRAMQTLINLVLLPLVELTSDPESYGFRPYRDCKMAISAVRMKLRTLSLENQHRALASRFGRQGLEAYTQLNENKWILDADINCFFENINHDWLINNLFLHPNLKEFVRLWLKAQILDFGKYIEPTTGTPQGGIISQTLANFTLNGLEKVVLDSIRPITTSKVRRLTIKDKGRVLKAVSLGVAIVRYAEDFIVIAKSKFILTNYIRPAIEKFLAERGLSLSHTKTKMFTLKEKGNQLDFLGYTFKYNVRWSSKRNIYYSKGYTGGIALYPNKEKVRNFIRKLKSIFDSSNNLSSVELITKLNPIIRGWANYYNLENSSHYRSVVRRSLYLNCWKWIFKKHPTLGKRTLAHMYFLRNAEKDIGTLNQLYANSKDIGTAHSKNNKQVFTKFLNSLWNFRGLASNLRRFSKDTSNKIVYLLDPTNAAKILSASRNVLPLKMRSIHAFHNDIVLLKRFKLKLAIASSSRTPSIKEKLLKKNKKDFVAYASKRLNRIS
jgi:RNA-directed DNA polymerase